MSVPQSHSSPEQTAHMEDVAKLGTELYQQKIRDQVEAGNKGKVLAIDVDTGEYEMGENALDSSDRLLARRPNARIWFERIGFQAMHKMRRPRQRF